MKLALIVALASLCLAAVVSQVPEASVSETTETTPTTAPTSSPSTSLDVSEAQAATTATTIAVSGGHDLVVDDQQSVPQRVRIAALDLDIDLTSVGVDDVGDFDVPASGIGWYHFGPSPGEDGSTVLAAHVDFNGSPGAFFRLVELVEGDEIEIDSDDGITRTYVVETQVLFDKTVLPADELFRESGDEVLRLITCGGQFDAETRHYVGNRVVTAVPTGERATSS